MQPCPPPPGLGILVVEDEAITLEFMVSTLAMKYPQFKVYKALEGKSGWELFLQHRPDIVLTDLNMPGLSGLELARMIRAEGGRVKLVAITGERRLSSEEDSTGTTFDHCLDKPVFFDELFEAMEKCLAFP